MLMGVLRDALSRAVRMKQASASPMQHIRRERDMLRCKRRCPLTAAVALYSHGDNRSITHAPAWPRR